MSVFVDTSTWSATFRRDRPDDVPQVHALIRALETGEQVVSTGLVLQELLQGFSGPKARDQIIDRFTALPFETITSRLPACATDVGNAEYRSAQSTLFAQLCIHHELTLLTLDEDLGQIAKHCPLRLWKSSG